MNESLYFSVGADTRAFQNEMKGLTKSLASVGAAYAAINTVVESFGKALDMGGRLGDLSAQTGETAGNLAVLERAFTNSGVAADVAGKAISKLQGILGDARKGSSSAIEKLDALGLTLEEFADKSPTDQLALIAEKIAAIPDPTDRTNAAMEIFGDKNARLIPLLRDFKGGLSEARVELGSLPKLLDENAEKLNKMGDKLTNLKEKGTEASVGFLSVFAGGINTALDTLNIDAAAAGKTAGYSFVDSLVGTLNPALSVLPKVFREYISKSEADMKKVADAAAPIAEIGEKFNASLLSAAQRLQGALGSSSIVDSLLGPPDDSWTKPRKPSMLDIGNYDPTWDDVDFSEQNQRTKDTATAERLARVRQQAEEERQRKIKEATDKINESFGGLALASDELQEALQGVPGYSNRSVGSTSATVGNQERKQSGTGASFSGAFKSGENSSGAAMNAGVGAYGFNEDGSPRTQREFETGKRDAATMKHEEQAAAKMGASKGKGGEKQTSPAAAALARIEAILARVEPKIPQHILS